VKSDIEIVQDALDATRRIAGVVGDDETVLWHLLRSILEWCDMQEPRVSFDELVDDARRDMLAHIDERIAPCDDAEFGMKP